MEKAFEDKMHLNQETDAEAQSSFPPHKMQTWCTSHNLVCDTFPLTSCYSQRDENEVYVPTELKGPNLTGKNAAKAHARQIKA